MEMNEFLEIMSLMMGGNQRKVVTNNSSIDSVDPCSFFEFSIIFPILQSLENWDTWIIITAGIRIEFFSSFLQIASYAILIFFCHSVDFQ